MVKRVGDNYGIYSYTVCVTQQGTVTFTIRFTTDDIVTEVADED